MKELSDYEKWVIEHKGTEKPFSSPLTTNIQKGIYVCRKCGSPLYTSKDKFDSHCGWPSFDDALPGSVERVKDTDGIRTEIICSSCKGHLGHVFVGEQFTEKNIRHCVNGTSLSFLSFL